MKKFICTLLITSSVSLLGIASNAYSISNNKKFEPFENSSASQTALNSLSPCKNNTDAKQDESKELSNSCNLKTSSDKTIKYLEQTSDKDTKVTSSNKTVTSNEINKPSNITDSKPSSVDTNKPSSINTVVKPSEEKLMNLVLNGESSLKSVFNSMASDTERIISQNNHQYGEVINFKSRNDMKKCLSPYFTDAVIESILNQYLIEHNGKLYFMLGNAGLRVDYKTCKKEFSYEDNKITIKFTEPYSNEDSISETKTLELINNQWIFSDFWYV